MVQIFGKKMKQTSLFGLFQIWGFVDSFQPSSPMPSFSTSSPSGHATTRNFFCSISSSFWSHPLLDTFIYCVCRHTIYMVISKAKSSISHLQSQNHGNKNLGFDSTKSIKVGSLCAPIEEWTVGGTALTSLMDVERRHDGSQVATSINYMRSEDSSESTYRLLSAQRTKEVPIKVTRKAGGRNDADWVQENTVVSISTNKLNDSGDHPDGKEFASC